MFLLTFSFGQTDHNDYSGMQKDNNLRFRDVSNEQKLKQRTN